MTVALWFLVWVGVGIVIELHFAIRAIKQVKQVNTAVSRQLAEIMVELEEQGNVGGLE